MDQDRTRSSGRTHGDANVLSDIERKRIKELQEATTKSRLGQPISWGLAQRLILARKGNLQKAIDLYENFVERFSKLNLLEIDPQHPTVLAQLTSGKYCLPGTQAQDGSALLVFRTQHHIVSRGQAHHHANLSACFFLLTEAQSTVQAQRLGVTIVFDMRGSAWSNIDYALIKTMLNLLQNAFPGRLANAYIYKSPRWFRAMTSLFWPFVKAKMKERVRFVDALHEDIAPNHLPDFLGGQLAYNHKASVDAMVTRYASERSQHPLRRRHQQQQQQQQQHGPQQQQQQQHGPQQQQRHEETQRKGRIESPHHHDHQQQTAYGQMQRARVGIHSSTAPQHPAHPVQQQQQQQQQQQGEHGDERMKRAERLRRRQQQERAKLDEQQQVRLQRSHAVHQQQQQQHQPRIASPPHHPPPVPPRHRGASGAPAAQPHHQHHQHHQQPQPRFQSQPHPRHHHPHPHPHRHSEVLPASEGARSLHVHPHASMSVTQDGASTPIGYAVSQTRRQHRQRHSPAHPQQQRGMAHSTAAHTPYPLQSPHVVSGPELHSFIKRLTETGEVVSHFAMLQLEEEEVDFSSAKLPVNVRKNRYANVLPNEHTRVRLLDADDIGGDYINANFVAGYRGPKRFVATQGPLRSTADDFWRMVWGVGASTIAMTAQEMEGGRNKCHRYWPNEQDETMEAGPIIIAMKDKKQWSESVIHRLFCLQHRTTGKTRCVDHLQFTAWPDHGVPADPRPFLDFHRNVTRFAERRPERGPIVVHCSAGIGRTGTLIAVDIARHQLQAEKRVDVYGIIRELRRQRAGMVQTPPQYLFCYQALAYLLEDGAL